MRKKLAKLTLTAVAAAVLAAVLLQTSSRDTPTSEAGNDPRFTSVTLSPLVVQSILDLVSAATAGGVAPSAFDADGFSAGDMCFLAFALRTATGEGDPSELEPSPGFPCAGQIPLDAITLDDFALLDPLDAEQVSENGDGYTDGLFVIVFDREPQGEPVQIDASDGAIWTDRSTTKGQHYLCDGSDASEDSDCQADPNIGTLDGVIQFAIGGELDSRGDFTVTLENELDNDDIVITLKGVGDPVEVVPLLNLDPKLEVGGTEVCRPDPDNEPFTFAELLQITTLAGLPDAGLVAVQVKDSDGTGLTGVPVEWTSEDEDIVLTGFENQFSLFNSGLLLGPNLACSGSETGTASVEVLVRGAAGFTIRDDVEFGRKVPQKRTTLSWTVIGKPAQLVAFADPPTIDCNGTNTSTINVHVLDANANNGVGGREVRYDISVLGTANPIVGTTNADGLSTSVVTPLAQEGTTGVPVLISGPIGIFTTVLVNCQVGAGSGVPGTGAPPPPAGGAGAGGQGPGGTITGPDTGSGGLAGRGSLPVWPAVALFIAAMGLAGARFGLRRSS